jgi:hypothetical protein
MDPKAQRVPNSPRFKAPRNWLGHCRRHHFIAALNQSGLEDFFDAEWGGSNASPGTVSLYRTMGYKQGTFLPQRELLAVFNWCDGKRDYLKAAQFLQLALEAQFLLPHYDERGQPTVALRFPLDPQDVAFLPEWLRVPYQQSESTRLEKIQAELETRERRKQKTREELKEKRLRYVLLQEALFDLLGNTSSVRRINSIKVYSSGGAPISETRLSSWQPPEWNLDRERISVRAFQDALATLLQLPLGDFSEFADLPKEQYGFRFDYINGCLIRSISIFTCHREMNVDEWFIARTMGIAEGTWRINTACSKMLQIFDVLLQRLEVAKGTAQRPEFRTAQPWPELSTGDDGCGFGNHS